jgi:hypothetical protein
VAFGQLRVLVGRLVLIEGELRAAAQRVLEVLAALSAHGLCCSDKASRLGPFLWLNAVDLPD